MDRSLGATERKAAPTDRSPQVTDRNSGDGNYGVIDG